MSLFPEVDKEISETERELHKIIKRIEEGSKVFTPSCSSEAFEFVEHYCELCYLCSNKDKFCNVLVDYLENRRHNDIRVDKNGAWLCLSSPMFIEIAKERFYAGIKNIRIVGKCY